MVPTRNGFGEGLLEQVLQIKMFSLFVPTLLNRSALRHLLKRILRNM
jgi:hypothetical protein